LRPARCPAKVREVVFLPEMLRMRTFGILLVALAWAIPAAAQDLQEAQQRLLRGNYAEARQLFSSLLKKGKAPAAVIGLGRAWRSMGEYDKAQEALQAGLKKQPTAGELWAELAELHYCRGQWQEAERAARKALEDGHGQFLAHWVLARLYRDRGDLKRSGEELVWFIRAYRDKEITDPEELCLVGQAACERARSDHRLNDQFQFVLTEIYGAIAKKNKNYWPALYLTGLLYLEKFKRGSAYRAFDKALQINPRAAEVLAAKGENALQHFEIKDAENFAEQALTINPRLPAALRLRADIALMAGDIQGALKDLNAARRVNPRAEKTLARLAACAYLQHKEADLAELCREVEKHDSKPGPFYEELAERLEERKRYEDAEKYYRLAIQFRPKLVGPRSSLGLLYMRLGREDEAQEILDKAFKDDPFNVRVYNTLAVLDHLKSYETLRTPHFLVRFDPKHDRVLAHFMAKYLEDIYAELAKEFSYQPKGPYLIEVFNKHEMFSGRVVALPDLHTIGASTGRMVALCSPRDKSGIISKPFNWNRVLRHELTHVFNLEQTRFQVPHWLTEGLAVRSEQLPMPSTWHYILMRKVASGDLLNLDNIHLGFIRPRSPEQWHQAYLQSLLYVNYLRTTYGPKVIGALLDAYRDGLDTGGALQKACQTSKADFEKGYRAFLQEQVKNLRGRPVVKAPSFEELKAAHQKDPANAEVTGRLAERYLLLGNRDAAQKLANAALEKQKDQPFALYVKARLALADKKPKEAITFLQAAVDRKEPELEALKLLGQLHFAAKDFAEAAKVFERGRQAQPYENYWLVQLARCYRQNDETDKLIETLKRLVPTDADDLNSRRELAQRLLKAGRPAEAERYAREALEIDVLDREAQDALLEALRAQGKDDELRQVRKLLERS
jgi:tetratricopeptide (TPR) repeat protein